MSREVSNAIYPHPFSKAYWRDACAELKNTRTLAFAALMIALRIVCKTISIPLAADLRIGIGFIVNAIGSMVYGPVVALLAAAITDTLGYVVAPNGIYFFPFIFTEMAGSLVYALFLYRAKVTPNRIILCRFCIDIFVNLLLQTPIMMWYYQVAYGKYYAPIDMLRIVKNVAMIPVESLILIIVLRMVIPPLQKMGAHVEMGDGLRLTKKNIALLAVLFAVSVGAVFGYVVYQYDVTSRSASWSAEERLRHNNEMNEAVRAADPALKDLTTVTVVESAMGKYFSDELTVDAAVYEVTAENPTAEELTALQGLSKSKAAQNESLQLIRKVRMTVDKNTWEVTALQEAD